jgi:broad specificity phosphatase PhoE
VADRGESFHQFRKRVIGWWIQTTSGLLADSLPDGPPLTVLVVSHGAFLRCLLQALTSDPEFHFTTSFSNGGKLGVMPNTGMSKLELVGVYEGRLLSYANNSHLRVLENNGERIECLNNNADDLAL